MWLRRVVSGVVAGVLVVSVASVPTAGAVDAAGLRASVPVPVASSVVPGAVSTGGGGVVPEPLSGRDFSSLPGSVVPSAGAGRVANGPVMPGVPEDVSVLPVVSRGEKFDVFDAGGGLQVARLYASAVNVQDAVGAWVRVDPTLVGDGRGGFVPRASKVPARFAGSSVGELARVGKPGLSAGFGMSGAVASSAVVTGSAVTYRDVQPGVDLEYRVGADLVKTTVVVKSAAGVGAGVWRFPLSVDAGLAPRLNGVGGVDVVDAVGGLVGSVPTPVMWDSKADPVSGDPGVYGPVSLALEGDAAAGWVVVVSADATWMRAKERVFPIHVDPTYNWNTPNLYDATIASGYPNNNYNVLWNSSYNCYENRVGYYDGSYGHGRALLGFDLSTIMDAQIYSASINAYFFHTYTIAPTPATVYQVTSGWSPTAVTWNTAPSFAESRGFTVGRGQWAAIDATDWVARWAARTLVYSGVEFAASGNVADFKRMASMENTNGWAPYLQVSFNRLSGMAAAQSPANGASLHAPTQDSGVPLTVSAVDPDGDPLLYYFRVTTGPDAESGIVAESSWITSPSWTVPAVNVPAGRTYYWHAYTSDDDMWPAWATAPNWVRSFTVTNVSPGAPTVTGPVAGGVVGTVTPTLSWSATSDADQDAVQYAVQVSSGGGGSSGQVASSGWLSDLSWTVPAGVLKDGVVYSWTVTSRDNRYQWVNPPGETRRSEGASPTVSFRVDQRLGLGKTVPSDAVGAVNVNLFNGNAVVSAGSPSIKAVGGDIGVSFTYNSKKQPESGLTGRYFEGLGNRDFPAGESAMLVRTDTQVAFNWGAVSPLTPAISADQFRVRWTGSLTPAETGSYQFGATHDDGVRVTVNGVVVLDRWADQYTGNDDFTGAANVALTAGQPVPIVIDYYENYGAAQVTALIQKMVNGVAQSRQPIPASWLTPAVAALPGGWEMSADVDGDGGYARATIADSSVALLDDTGSVHTYTRNSDGSYTPPVGESGVLAKDPTGAFMLTEDSGRLWRFDGTGAITSVTSPADDRKPATAAAVYSTSAAGAPQRLATLKDPLSLRALTFRYNRACPMVRVNGVAGGC